MVIDKTKLICDFKTDNKDNIVIHDDCFNVFQHIQSKSVKLILCDLPYGTTNCSWDIVIPLNDYIKIGKRNLTKEEFLLEQYKKGVIFKDAVAKFESEKNLGLWSHYKRIIKDNGCIVLTAQTPFDKVLGNSNLKMLRYEWIWEKTQATGAMNSKKMPMKAHENVLVFYSKRPEYNPIMTDGHVRKVSKAKNRAACIERRNNTDNIYGNEYADKVKDYDSTTRYPRSVVKFKTDKQKLALHKTQKPIDLMKYFIETYSSIGDLVLDNCCGSGTTGKAAQELDRRFIMIENDEKSYKDSCQRLGFE